MRNHLKPFSSYLRWMVRANCSVWHGSCWRWPKRWHGCRKSCGRCSKRRIWRWKPSKRRGKGKPGMKQSMNSESRIEEQHLSTSNFAWRLLLEQVPCWEGCWRGTEGWGFQLDKMNQNDTSKAPPGCQRRPCYTSCDKRQPHPCRCVWPGWKRELAATQWGTEHRTVQIWARLGCDLEWYHPKQFWFQINLHSEWFSMGWWHCKMNILLFYYLQDPTNS